MGNVAALVLFIVLAGWSAATAARGVRRAEVSGGPMTRTPNPTRGFWPLRDLPVVGWLLAVVAVALLHPFVPAPRWLMIHLLLLGAVSHAIMVWSRYFADALLHIPPHAGDRRIQSIRLLGLNTGVLGVLIGVLGGSWPVAALGATAVAAAVLAHGVALVRQLRRALPSRFGATVRYYVAAAGLLPVGAALGTALARGLGDPVHEQVILAHVSLNVLGWIGLTIVGTLVTLWPTMLRTRIAAGSERAARRALPILVLAIGTTSGGALAGRQLLAALGLIGYLAGLAVVARPFVTTARSKPPASYPTWSVAAGLGWLLGCLSVLAVGVGTASSWAVVGDRLDQIAPLLTVGFAAQVLLGALSYLVPVALGGGPASVRAATAAMERSGPLRVVMVNAALLVGAPPVPSVVRVACSALVLVGLSAFIPLLFTAMRASRREQRSPSPPAGDRPAES